MSLSIYPLKNRIFTKKLLILGTFATLNKVRTAMYGHKMFHGELCIVKMPFLNPIRTMGRTEHRRKVPKLSDPHNVWSVKPLKTLKFVRLFDSVCNVVLGEPCNTMTGDRIFFSCGACRMTGQLVWWVENVWESWVAGWCCVWWLVANVATGELGWWGLVLCVVTIELMWQLESWANES
jgi:hypothetical protein